jgi:uncharacterized protein (DUF362 family)
LLVAGGAAVAGASALGLARRWLRPRAAVFVAAGQAYDARLVTTIADGLLAAGLDSAWLRGRRVLLKPNLVEPVRTAPHMTTHPAMVAAAVEVFRRWGASVVVGEAPGHMRDTEFALVESGMDDALRAAGAPFADLNYEESRWLENRGRFSPLAGIHFPRSVLEADLVVSMPKMKTHHWAGITASMKNLYGTLPGIVYGWPKNVLHHAGIPQTAVDINATLPARKLAIVDAIECMEGDGPIMGTPKTMGLVLIGTNLPAVDATAARLMGVDPYRIKYLELAADQLGPLDDERIEQRGEAWRPLVDPFQIIDSPHLAHLRPAENVT